MSCADVCIDMDNDDCDFGFMSAGMRAARKPYKCSECREPIAAGARYEYAAGKSDGDFWTARTCLLCAEIRDALVCGGFIGGHLWEQIREYVFPEWEESSPVDCLAKVESLAARNKLRDAYADWKR